MLSLANLPELFSLPPSCLPIFPASLFACLALPALPCLIFPASLACLFSLASHFVLLDFVLLDFALLDFALLDFASPDFQRLPFTFCLLFLFSSFSELHLHAQVYFCEYRAQLFVLNMLSFLSEELLHLF